jgi:thiol-disulfide isomerase/thioredoxin
VVGENHELLEWDTPNPFDAGVGAPRGLDPSVPTTEGPDEMFGDGCTYMGVTYTRPFRHYLVEMQALPPPDPLPQEVWLVEALQPVLEAIYPPGPAALDYPLYMPQEPLAANASECRLLGLAYADKPQATWKEFVVLRHHKTVHVFNVLSHGRRMYRQLIYSSNTRFSLEGFEMNALTATRPLPEDVRFSGGNAKEAPPSGSSLIIVRQNEVIQGREVFLPARLLRGVIPGALLGSCQFWQGEDSLLRGYPKNASDEWLGYKVEVTIRDDGTANIIRRDTSPFSVIENGNKADDGPSLARVGSRMSRTSTLGSVDSSGAELSRIVSSNTSGAGRAQRLVDACSPLPVSQAVAEYALDAFQREDGCEDYDCAESWIRDPDNADAIEQIAAGSSTGGLGDPLSSAGGDVLASKWTRPERHTGDKLVLLNILNADPTTIRYKYAQIFSRLEDLSHVLMWSKNSHDHADGEVTIYKVELPRLRMAFMPKIDSDGVTRLHSLDQSGWFVSEAASLGPERSIPDTPGMKYLDELLRGISNCLVLENNSKQLQILVTSHEVRRPPKKGEPFSTEVVFNRISGEWEDVMVNQRTFIYPVHASYTYFETRNLESVIYLMLLRFVNRDYEGSFRLITSLCVDVDFTAAEAWVFRQIYNIEDKHPNAHAIRLKLSLALQFSDNKVEWDAMNEYNSYLIKLSHVSAACRLSIEEEEEIMDMVQSGTTMIKNRDSYLHALTHGITRSRQITPELKNGGKPWFTMQFYNPPVAVLQAQDLGVVTYKYERKGQDANGQLGDDEILELLFEDEVTKDDQGGSVRQLGFLFLYELLTGGTAVNFCGRDCTSSVASLLTQMFFMRHSTWGRNAQSTAHSSKQFATLSAILDAPDGHTWPQIPEDCLTHLAEGLDIKPSQDVRGLPGAPRPPEDSSFSRFLVAMQAEHARVRQAVTHDALLRTRQNSLVRMELKRSQLQGNMSVFVVGNDPTCVYPAASDASRDSIVVVPFAATSCGSGVSVSEADAAAARQVPFAALFADVLLLRPRTGEVKPASEILNAEAGLTGLYFSAGWCKPCQTFTPLLVDFYKEVQDQGIPLEIVFVSLDKSADEMQAYVQKLDMPWTVIPFESTKREELKLRYAVTQVPCLLVFGADGTLKTLDAIRDVRKSPSKLKDWAQSDGYPEFHLVAAREPEPVAGSTECTPGASVELTSDDVNAFATIPLHPLGLTTFVEREKKPVQVLDKLPFQMENHPEAQGASVSGEMLKRFQADCKLYSDKVAQTTNYWFKLINLANINAYLDDPSNPGIDEALQLLEQLQVTLQAMQRRDAKSVEAALDESLSMANTIPAQGNKIEREDRARFELLQFCGVKAKIPLLFALSTLMSSKGAEDIKSINPYCADPTRVHEILVAMILYTMRVGQANMLSASILSMKDSLVRIKKGGFDRADMLNKVQHASSGLAKQLSTQRHSFLKNDSSGIHTIDPRFLIFEFSFGFALRKRQVEMCNSFIQNAAADESSCQQMIMGAGKTSVIGPLVALCLADSTRLVTLTMPSRWVPV